MRTEARIGLLAVLAGCQTVHMGQFGEEEGIRCEATSRTPVLPEDTVEVGYIDAPHIDAPQTVLVGDMLAVAAGTFVETLRWSDLTETAVTAILDGAGSPELVTYEDAGDEHETEPGPCPTLLEFTVDVTLDTEDGRMSDGFVAVAGTRGEGVYVEHRVTAPGGTIDVQALAREAVAVEPDVIRVDLGVSQDGTLFWGSLRPQLVGGPDEDTTSVGVWPAEGVEWARR